MSTGSTTAIRAPPGAQLLPRVEGVTEAVHAMASGGSGSGLGSGGMTLEAAGGRDRHPRGHRAGDRQRHARRAARARDSAADVGTLFLPTRGDRARKAWLGGRLRLKGALVVDAGCARALAQGRQPARERHHRGRRRVHARRPGGGARCRPATPSRAGPRRIWRRRSGAIRGRRSEEHAALLGYAPRSAVIHRDQLVLL
jgi:glutamate 5-kinase